MKKTIIPKKNIDNDAFAKTPGMAKQKFGPARPGDFSGAKATIRVVEVLKKRRNAVGRTFGDAINDSGATAVEFALILIPLLLLIFGIIEFGLLVFNQQMITNASREGARAGIALHSPKVSVPAIQSRVSAFCADHLVTFGTTASPIIDVPTGPCGGVFGQPLTVRVQFQYDYLFLSNFGIGPKTLVAVSTMRCE